MATLADFEQIWEALESSAPLPRKSSAFGQRATPERSAILAQRKHLLGFLENIDGDLSVAELREALEDYE
ncbi:hypothetical protein [Oricola indica]|jgi:hypothetical protein|uniref:hypothetical protein n=1 Tax=Oricola indica TaxID=2872591 RepID=UPI001CC18CC5|nr:hypothetical protein [Oricola indica]